MKEEEIKRRMKLTNLERFNIGLCILAAITALVGAIILMNLTQLVVAMLWSFIALEDYFNIKTRKSYKLYEESLWNLINSQYETINALMKED